jgi:serine/threonine protein kinase
MDQGNAPTLASGAATLKAAVSELPGPQLEDLVRLDRYESGNLIGKGGMGEVRQCHDVRLNRHIALKTATTRNKAELSRFVREAQVQGQLEHPSIVPVYELGVGADGAPYFAMKRVRGESLWDVLTRLQEKQPEALAKYPRRRLLSAFLHVCQAVDYAHVNGWLHRDLKPANIMLGDFGEVYVLDWGLARRLDAKDDERTSEPTPLAPVGLTTPGSLMGTPGYMAPEQVNGQRADQRSDVYALGAILFEVLTHQMLAKGASTMELLINTRDGVDARARMRAPHAEVPPELEAICLKASALEPKERFASVRELHDVVDRVVAGERDHELRADLAVKHTEAAVKADALAKSDAPNELEHRKTALREVSQALALDPASPTALKTLVDLMQTAPKTIPPEARQEIEDLESAGLKSGTRTAGMSFMGMVVAGMIMFAMFPNRYILLSNVLFMLAAAIAFYQGMQAKPSGRAAIPGLVVSNLAIMSMFFFDGPLTILPACVAVNTLAWRVSLGSRYKRLVLGLGLAAIVLPILGSWVGVLPETFRFEDGKLVLLPLAMPFEASYMLWVLIGGFVATLAVGTAVVGRTRDANANLARMRAMQQWNLQQLLPPGATAKTNQTIDHTIDPLCAVGRLRQSLHG